MRDIKINAKLLKEIEEYCKINDMDTNEYINATLSNALNHDKYVVFFKDAFSPLNEDESIDKKETNISTIPISTTEIEKKDIIEINKEEKQENIVKKVKKRTLK